MYHHWNNALTSGKENVLGGLFMLTSVNIISLQSFLNVIYVIWSVY